MAKPDINLTGSTAQGQRDILRPTERQIGTSLVGNSPFADAVTTEPQEGEFKRNLMTWKIPQFGNVIMYVNPESLSISESKVISSVRTKSGFVVQYGGEELTKISLRGTTGSAGMEGINVLDSVYRSEQLAFNSVAESLQQKLAADQLYSLVSGAGVISSIGDDEGNPYEFNIFEQPYPTLSSLAASIEMFYQGVTYRGYFKSLSVTEDVVNLGIFSYSLEFESYAKTGVRRNFMPWHRQPKFPADSTLNPLSYYSNENVTGPTNTPSSEDLRRTPPESSLRADVGRTARNTPRVSPSPELNTNENISQTVQKRFTDIGIAENGDSLTNDLDLDEVNDAVNSTGDIPLIN